jgi:branched-chain amino acid transport system ATP-binding protein
VPFPGSKSSLIEAENISVRYGNGAMGLHSASLVVEPGEVVALCGANGAGKTTMVRAISGLLRSEGTRITQGHVRVQGMDVTQREPYEISRRGVYVIPERRKIFPNLSVGANLNSLGGLPSRATRQDRLERIFTLFPDLRGRMSQAAGRLSGGQQQMLAIARALMVDARVLLVDEIALGLHPSVLKPLFHVIREIVGDERGAIIVHEDVRYAPTFADRYYVLEAGRTVAEGNTAELAHAQEQRVAAT